MGNAIGSARAFALRKIRRFNVENRTHRFIEKNTTSAAPKPSATVREIENIRKEYPKLLDEINKEDKALNDRLKEIYVTALDPPPERLAKKENPLRPLPVSRDSYSLPEYGYVELGSVTAGRVSLKQALEILTKHHIDKDAYTAQNVALDYNLNQKDAENLIKYFRLFRLQPLEQEVTTITSGDFGLLDTIEPPPKTLEDVFTDNEALTEATKKIHAVCENKEEDEKEAPKKKEKRES